MTSARCAAWAIATIADAVDSCAASDEVAFVLHRRPYGETSLLVDLFACNGGRLRLVARGARRNRVGQPFTELAVAWSGRSQLKTLTRAEPMPASCPALAGRVLYLGLYLNELLLRLLPEGDPHPRLYERYRTLLTVLAAGAEAEPALRRFELALLEDLGYGIALAHTLEGDPVRPEADYRFVGGAGLTLAGVPAGRGEPLRGAHLLAIAADDYRDPAVRHSAKRLLRAALAEHLGTRPLRSRELFRDPGTEPETSA